MSSNTRRADRLEHELLVAYKTADGFHSDPAVNVSKGGLFINTRKTLPVGSPLEIILSLPGTVQPLNVAGRVARVSEGGPGGEQPGMAVEFLDVDADKSARIEQLVQRLRKELPGGKR